MEQRNQILYVKTHGQYLPPPRVHVFGSVCLKNMTEAWVKEDPIQVWSGSGSAGRFMH